MHRRNLIQTIIGTASITALAGCSSFLGADDPDPSATENEDTPSDTKEPTDELDTTDNSTREERNTDVTLTQSYANVEDRNDDGFKNLYVGGSLENPTNGNITVRLGLEYHFSNTENNINEANRVEATPGTTDFEFPLLPLVESNDFFTTEQIEALRNEDFEFEMWIAEEN